MHNCFRVSIEPWLRLSITPRKLFTNTKNSTVNSFDFNIRVIFGSACFFPSRKAIWSFCMKLFMLVILLGKSNIMTIKLELIFHSEIGKFGF